MGRNDRETHNFMNVDSFSQLPLTRTKEKSIRLFGKEVGGDSSTVIIADESDSNDTADVVQEESKETTGESNKIFECHYCSRNFPTSQALGGHQNAHKRERQHAKRAHLQSTMFNNRFTDAQMYGFMNFHRQIPPYYNQHQQQPPSWVTTNYNAFSTTTSVNNISTRFYGGNATYASHQTPINGSPMATWRFPTTRSLTFSNNLMVSRVGTESNSQIRYSYEQKSSVRDQVSLDLHL